MDEKGQMQIIDTAIMGLIGLTVLALMIAALWPLVGNMLDLTTTAPGYNMFRPIADFLPAILFLMLIVAIIRSATGQQQQRQY